MARSRNERKRQREYKIRTKGKRGGEGQIKKNFQQKEKREKKSPRKTFPMKCTEKVKKKKIPRWRGNGKEVKYETKEGE